MNVRLLAAVACLVTTLATRLPAAAACTGDCNGDGEVTVDELILGVGIALGSAAVDRCVPIDASGDSEVTIDEIIAAVNVAHGVSSGSGAPHCSQSRWEDRRARHRGAVGAARQRRSARHHRQCAVPGRLLPGHASVAGRCHQCREHRRSFVHDDGARA